jgi:hypothetical protein
MRRLLLTTRNRERAARPTARRIRDQPPTARKEVDDLHLHQDRRPAQQP